MEDSERSEELKALWALFEAPFHTPLKAWSIPELTASEANAQKAFSLAGAHKDGLQKEYNTLWQSYLEQLSLPENEAVLATFIRELAFYPYEGKYYRLVRALFMQGYAESQEKILTELRALPVSPHVTAFLEEGFREAAGADRAIKAYGNDIPAWLLRRALDTDESSIGTPLFVLFIRGQYALLCRGFFSYELNEMDFKDLHLNRVFDPERCVEAVNSEYSGKN